MLRIPVIGIRYVIADEKLVVFNMKSAKHISQLRYIRTTTDNECACAWWVSSRKGVSDFENAKTVAKDATIGLRESYQPPSLQYRTWYIGYAQRYAEV